jgi:hypothetical protein
VARHDVVGDGLEATHHVGELLLVELLGLGGEADEVGEAHADPVPLPAVARSGGASVQVTPPHELHHLRHHGEQLGAPADRSSPSIRRGRRREHVPVVVVAEPRRPHRVEPVGAGAVDGRVGTATSPPAGSAPVDEGPDGSASLVHVVPRHRRMGRRAGSRSCRPARGDALERRPHHAAICSATPGPSAPSVMKNTTLDSI